MRKAAAGSSAWWHVHLREKRVWENARTPSRSGTVRPRPPMSSLMKRAGYGANAEEPQEEVRDWTPARRPTLPAGRRAPLRGKTRVRPFSIGSKARARETGTVDGLRQPVAAERPSVEGGAKTLSQARPPQSSRWAKPASLHGNGPTGATDTEAG